MFFIFMLFIKISPLELSYNLQIRFATEDFPDPVLPNIPRLVLFLIVKHIFFMALIFVFS